MQLHTLTCMDALKILLKFHTDNLNYLNMADNLETPIRYKFFSTRLAQDIYSVQTIINTYKIYKNYSLYLTNELTLLMRNSRDIDLQTSHIQNQWISRPDENGHQVQGSTKIFILA